MAKKAVAATKSRMVSAGKKPQTKPQPQAEGAVPNGFRREKPQAEGAGKLAHEVIANSLAKEAHGEVLRWRINEANGELIVLLVDGRKLYSRF